MKIPLNMSVALLLLASLLWGCSPVSQAGAGAFLGGFLGAMAEEASYKHDAPGATISLQKTRTIHGQGRKRFVHSWALNGPLDYQSREQGPG